MATQPVGNPRPVITPDYNENNQEGRDNEVRQGITGQGVRYVLGVGLAAAIVAMIIVAVFAMHS